jgi:hypothetical protein
MRNRDAAKAITRSWFRFLHNTLSGFSHCPLHALHTPRTVNFSFWVPQRFEIMIVYLLALLNFVATQGSSSQSVGCAYCTSANCLSVPPGNVCGGSIGSGSILFDIYPPLYCCKLGGCAAGTYFSGNLAGICTPCTADRANCIACTSQLVCTSCSSRSVDVRVILKRCTGGYTLINGACVQVRCTRWRV